MKHYKYLKNFYQATYPSDEAGEEIRTKAKKIDQGQAYLIYLMLHHLEVAGLFEDETCDQRWDIAKQHIVEFEESEWDDENKSHYECFEEYAESFVKYWFKGKERNMTKYL